MIPERPGARAEEPTVEAGWIERNGWLLAAVWLVFLIFPLLTILEADDITTGAKVAAVVLIVIFCAIYIHGFQIQHQAEMTARDRLYSGIDLPDGRLHLAGLITASLTLYAVVELPAIGVVPFVVSFAVFHFAWPVVGAIVGLALVVTLGVPLLVGGLGDVWFLSLIVVAVTVATVLIRVVETHQVAQTRLRTGLAVSDERSRVARDVHDVLGHSLTAVILKAELAGRMLDGVDLDDEDDRERVESCRAQLAELQSISRSALAEIRSTVGGLRAANLADEVTVARTVLADAGVDLLVTGEVASVPEHQRSMLAWVVRESVTNVVRHAQAKTCHIELAPGPGPVVLRVSDDGVGLGSSNGEADPGRLGNGLRGLQERVEAGGARLRLGSDGGTQIEVAVGS